MIAYLGFPPFVVTLGMLSIARSFGMIASNNQTVFQFGPDHDKLLALGGGAWVFGISNPVIYTLVLAPSPASSCAGPGSAATSSRSAATSMRRR